MRHLKTITLATLMLLGASATAEEKMLEMATGKGCFICHSIQSKPGSTLPLAPAYEEIAEHYREVGDAAGFLADRILSGTLGAQQNWKGKVNMAFMPPNVNVSEQEAKLLAEWIVGLNSEAVTPAIVEHEEMLILAVQGGCTTCHSMEKQADNTHIELAPAFREVAKRYSSTENAKAILVKSILEGTMQDGRKWPDVNMLFMPPNVALNKQDAETLADWILSLE
ncbi:MAG: c-type cytochrome [Thiolinea sp.]